MPLYGENLPGKRKIHTVIEFAGCPDRMGFKSTVCQTEGFLIIWFSTFLEILEDLEIDGLTNLQKVTEVASHVHRRFDNKGDIFYEISALHRSVRGSDPDVALYWLC